MVQNYSQSKAWMSFVTPLINIFLKRIMSEALEEHGRRVSIGGRNITNLEFADDIDAQAEKSRN